MRQRGVLCHCSPSRNKPFCDGSHLTAEITPDAPFEREHTAAHRAGREARGPCPKGRPLSIHVEHDDPHTGSELAWRGDECALYRCGEFPKNLSVMIPIEKNKEPTSARSACHAHSGREGRRYRGGTAGNVSEAFNHSRGPRGEAAKQAPNGLVSAR
jgi:hypothetical protein